MHNSCRLFLCRFVQFAALSDGVTRFPSEIISLLAAESSEENVHA